MKIQLLWHAMKKNGNQIVGACITGVDTPNATLRVIEESKLTASKKWSQYLRLYAQLDSESKIYQRFNVNEVFHVHALVVDANYRNRSIGGKLMEKCYQLGASRGYEVCSVNCSSVYTEKIAINCKMQFMSEIAMDSFVDENGMRLIYPPAPHTHIRTYAKRL
jgi:GNAT superfamily N-acetyltransferase